MAGASGPTMDLSPRRRSIWDLPNTADTQPPQPPHSTSQLIPLHKLWANPFNPRLVYDDAEIDAMADSIRAEGLLQDLMIADIGPFLAYWTNRLDAAPRQRALLTESLAKARPDDYVILIGHNRHAACAHAGLDHAPCRTRNDKIDRARVLALPENLRRVKLNPIEEALGFHGAVEDGLTQAEIASQVGCRQPHISRRLKLLHLVDELRDAVMDKTLRTADAELIASALPDGDGRQTYVLSHMRIHRTSASAALAHLRAEQPPIPQHPRPDAENHGTLSAPAPPEPGNPDHNFPEPPPTPNQQPATLKPTAPVTADTTPSPQGVRDAHGSQARASACRLLLQATTSPNPREALRLLTPALLLADHAAHRLARTWLNTSPSTHIAPQQPFADLLDQPTAKPANRAALAIALAALERRTEHTPRPWTTADRTYIEHLTRHAGYHPTPWEQAQLHSKAPAADIPSE